MITLTKLNGVTFVLNCEQVEHMSANPDTTIYLTTGNFYVVRESLDEEVRKVIEYRQEIFRHLLDPKTLTSDEA